MISSSSTNMKYTLCRQGPFFPPKVVSLIPYNPEIQTLNSWRRELTGSQECFVFLCFLPFVGRGSQQNCSLSKCSSSWDSHSAGGRKVMLAKALVMVRAAAGLPRAAAGPGPGQAAWGPRGVQCAQSPWVPRKRLRDSRKEMRHLATGQGWGEGCRCQGVWWLVG